MTASNDSLSIDGATQPSLQRKVSKDNHNDNDVPPSRSTDFTIAFGSEFKEESESTEQLQLLNTGSNAGQCNSSLINIIDLASSNGNSIASSKSYKTNHNLKTVNKSALTSNIKEAKITFYNDDIIVEDRHLYLSPCPTIPDIVTQTSSNSNLPRDDSVSMLNQLIDAQIKSLDAFPPVPDTITIKKIANSPSTLKNSTILEGGEEDANVKLEIPLTKRPFYPVSVVVNALAGVVQDASTGIGNALSNTANNVSVSVNSLLSNDGNCDGNVEDPANINYTGHPNTSTRITAKYNGNITRRPILGVKEYMSMFDTDGRIQNPELVRKRVFEGGVDNDIRSSLWEFLLGVFSWKSTYDERLDLRKINTLKYKSMKDILQSLKRTDSEENNFDLIEKDVIRNDRNQAFFAGDDNQNVETIDSILKVYSLVHNPSLGYVQGMSDFAGLVVYVCNSESDAFWLFEKIMSFQGDFFMADTKNAMNRQFNTLLTLLNECDRDVFNILKKAGANDILFAYRWMLLNMKREVSFEDSLTVNETIWSMPIEKYIENRIDLGTNPYILFLALAGICLFRDDIKQLENDSSEIHMYMNNIGQHLEVTELLNKAESLFWRFVSRDGVPKERMRDE